MQFYYLSISCQECGWIYSVFCKHHFITIIMVFCSIHLLYYLLQIIFYNFFNCGVFSMSFCFAQYPQTTKQSIKCKQIIPTVYSSVPYGRTLYATRSFCWKILPWHLITYLYFYMPCLRTRKTEKRVLCASSKNFLSNPIAHDIRIIYEYRKKNYKFITILLWGKNP